MKLSITEEFCKKSFEANYDWFPAYLEWALVQKKWFIVVFKWLKHLEHFLWECGLSVTGLPFGEWLLHLFTFWFKVTRFPDNYNEVTGQLGRWLEKWAWSQFTAVLLLEHGCYETEMDLGWVLTIS